MTAPPTQRISCESIARDLFLAEHFAETEDRVPRELAGKYGLTLGDFEDYVGRNADQLLIMVGRQIEQKKLKNARKAARRKDRRARDPLQRVLDSQRTRLAVALKGYRVKKRNSTFGSFGYDVQALVAHLTPMLRPGMTWGNYGKVWHIDHIRPVSDFDFTESTGDAIRECWALANLQPLFARDNLSKGARYGS